VYARSTVTGQFGTVLVVKVRVTPPPNPQMALDQPRVEWSSVPGTFLIKGWAVDLASYVGSGIDAVHAWAYPLLPTGYGDAIWVNHATLGIPRPDVATYFGNPELANAGFEMAGTLPRGTYDLVVYARSWIAGSFNNWRTVRITIE
jgi:hypothetical protein